MSVVLSLGVLSEVRRTYETGGWLVGFVSGSADGAPVLASVVAWSEGVSVECVEAHLPADVCVVGWYGHDASKAEAGFAAQLPASNGLARYRVFPCVEAGSAAGEKAEVSAVRVCVDGADVAHTVVDGGSGAVRRLYEGSPPCRYVVVEAAIPAAGDAAAGCWEILDPVGSRAAADSSSSVVHRVVSVPGGGGGASSIRVGAAACSVEASVVHRRGLCCDAAVLQRLRAQAAHVAARAAAGEGPAVLEAAACHFWPPPPAAAAAAVASAPGRRRRTREALAHPVTLLYCVQPLHRFFGTESTPAAAWNTATAERAHAVLDAHVAAAEEGPVFKTTQRWRCGDEAGDAAGGEDGSSGGGGPGRCLTTVHELLELGGPAPAGAERTCVRGAYTYYHYRCDGARDDGWGCAYRSLQTLLSWYLTNAHAEGCGGPGHRRRPRRQPPSLREIQELLLEVDPSKKSTRFVGSSEWIGSAEIFLVLNSLLGVECVVRRLDSGRALATDASVQQMLHEHFAGQGSPVMVGGRQYAHTILGVETREGSAGCRLLILDPHYPALRPDLGEIRKGGWCAWRDPASLFKADSWYNICLPQRPAHTYR
eukprot:Rhum_TRINITY_DN14408_c3_g2::Rhum_TRINITY_DN14408_c3_g2_i1::g.88580::m.88580/K01376/UFSP2; UFM1-specific protease 2